jgi:hypothetical protein
MGGLGLSTQSCPDCYDKWRSLGLSAQSCPNCYDKWRSLGLSAQSCPDCYDKWRSLGLSVQSCPDCYYNGGALDYRHNPGQVVTVRNLVSLDIRGSSCLPLQSIGATSTISFNTALKKETVEVINSLFFHINPSNRSLARIYIALPHPNGVLVLYFSD